MKQTVEEAAYDYATNKTKFRKEVLKEVDPDNYISRKSDCMEDFQCGAEWHAKQSPWISVEERLPETNEGQSLYEVIVVTSDRRFLVVINTEVEHLVGLLGVTHWMPIPSFDEILEANRDVLERIKEKGD
jgi:hypothetical protein|nr:MAG TPA: Protein of unknown function (DUF551) [Caudoviricetes sp.]